MGRPEYSPDDVSDLFYEENLSAASRPGILVSLTERLGDTRNRVIAGAMVVSIIGGGLIAKGITDSDGSDNVRGGSPNELSAPADHVYGDDTPDEIDFGSMTTTSTVPLEAADTTIAELTMEVPSAAAPGTTAAKPAAGGGTHKARTVSATPTTTNESNAERQRREAAEAETAAERQRREAAEAELAAERRRQADADAAEKQRQAEAAEAERQRQEAAAEAERQRQAKRLRWCNKLAEIAVEDANGDDTVMDIGLIDGKTYRYSEMHREGTFYSYTEAPNTYRVKVVDCSDKIKRAEFGLIDNSTDGQTPAWWEPEV